MWGNIGALRIDAYSELLAFPKSTAILGVFGLLIACDSLCYTLNLNSCRFVELCDVEASSWHRAAQHSIVKDEGRQIQTRASARVLSKDVATHT